MKYKIVLFIILFPAFAVAQTKDSPERVLKDLVDSWTLGVDSTSDAVNIRVYNKFKNLFVLNATLEDDFNAVYHYGSKSYKINITGFPKPFDVYAHNIALQVSKLRIDTVSTEINATDPQNIFITIKRTVYAEKKRQYVIGNPKAYVDAVADNRTIIFEKQDKDQGKEKEKMKREFENKLKDSKDSIYIFSGSSSLLINIIYDRSDSTFKIEKIKNIGEPDIRCKNDADMDAVLDQEEEETLIIKQKPGDFTAKGNPDYDLDGVPDVTDKCPKTYGNINNKGCPLDYFITNNKFDGFIGLQLNSAKINLPELNNLGYVDESGNDAMDVLQSQKGVLKNPGLVAGVFAGGNFTHYFGKNRKQTGISIGFTYAGFTADYQLTVPVVYTYKSSDGVNDYRRQVTIDSLKEEIKYNIFNFPVMFNYRWHFGKRDATGKRKWVTNAKAGPSLMLFSATSNYNANISFGGLYETDNNGITYSDLFDTAAISNVYITADRIITRNPDRPADEVFKELHDADAGYDFADSKNFRDTKKNASRITVAINLAFDMQRQISDAWAFKFGAHVVYAPLPAQKEKYKPVDKTTDPYQSIYNSNAKSSYSAFGINLGFVYNF